MNCCIAQLVVKGQLEDIDKFMEAVSIDATDTRIGLGIENASINAKGEKDGIPYYYINGEVKGSVSYCIIDADYFTNEDKTKIKSISMQTASKLYNCEVEIFGSDDECCEHYIYDNGKYVSFDTRFRNVWGITKKNFKSKFKILKSVKS